MKQKPMNISHVKHSCKFILFLFLFCCHLTETKAQDKKGITYLKKDNFGSVYIMSDTTRPEYKWITPGAPTDKWFSLFRMNMEEAFKDTVIATRHFQIPSSVPHDFIPLYLIKDKLYLYAPSDWTNSYYTTLTDSLLIINTSEGPYGNFITSFSGSSTAVKMQVTNGKYRNDISMKLIVGEQQVWLWETREDDIITKQYYTVPSAVKMFPMVVCDCGGMKCKLEYKFDKVE